MVKTVQLCSKMVLPEYLMENGISGSKLAAVTVNRLRPVLSRISSIKMDILLLSTVIFIRGSEREAAHKKESSFIHSEPAKNFFYERGWAEVTAV